MERRVLLGPVIGLEIVGWRTGPQPCDAERAVHPFIRFLVLATAFTASPASPAEGQLPIPHPRRVPDGTLGLELSVLDARGDFRPGHTLAVGYGARGALRWGPRRAFDIGLAFRSITHDSRHFSDTLDVQNMIRTLVASTRYMLPLRYVRPYMGVSAGLAYFGTETYVDRCCDQNGDRERNLDGIALATLVPTTSTRVGLAIDVARMPGPTPSTLAVDLGIETHYGRRASYQVGGDGQIRRTGTGYRVYSLGVSVRTR